MSEKLSPERLAEIRTRRDEGLECHDGYHVCETWVPCVENDIPALPAHIAAVEAERDEHFRRADENYDACDSLARDNTALRVQRDDYAQFWKERGKEVLKAVDERDALAAKIGRLERVPSWGAADVIEMDGERALVLRVADFDAALRDEEAPK